MTAYRDRMLAGEYGPQVATTTSSDLGVKTDAKPDEPQPKKRGRPKKTTT